MIWKARRLRKALGGGMRQTGFVLCIFYVFVFVRCIIEYCKWIGFSGVVAAAGLFGLEHVYPRLGEDHARWKKKIMPMKNFIFMPLILRKDFGQSEKILIQSLKWQLVSKILSKCPFSHSWTIWRAVPMKCSKRDEFHKAWLLCNSRFLIFGPLWFFLW